MNLNILAYCIYLLLTGIIILKVGQICYQKGNQFVAQLLPNHQNLCIRVNQMLLLGYYLLNLGYCAMTLISWKTIYSLPQLIEIIALKSSIIILTIAIMHYLNIFLIIKYIKKYLLTGKNT